MLLFLVSLAYVLCQWPLTVCNIIFFERKSDRKKSFFVLANGTYCSLKSTNFKTPVILAKVTEKVRMLITIESL